MLRDVVLALARKYDFEEGHSLQDERLALRLFDETARLGLHRLAEAGTGVTLSAPSARDILSCAAILHDIGYVEGYQEHHKTAYRLITAATIEGLTDRERELVAHVARYHRAAQPDVGKHRAFAALALDDRHVVTQLGALLRFADGLDRSHTNAVNDLHCDLIGSQLVISLLPGRNDAEERSAGQRKARWFESVFEVQVVLK
jgi:exopolyphosphatase / guanosine-5'-triphosphate,3'-diphosphate pyrophosphatase